MTMAQWEMRQEIARLRAEVDDLRRKLDMSESMSAECQDQNGRLTAALRAVKAAYDSASWTDAVAMEMPAVRAALADEQLPGLHRDPDDGLPATGQGTSDANGG